ncbi:hypothetical protein V8G69_06135 [Gaetbulibacter sp. M235]|uniref:hypothetical protein n=1 Tax=Gaetbulibacter sp. M235 TaxID=3126510 RepID=UPI00374FB52A
MKLIQLLAISLLIFSCNNQGKQSYPEVSYGLKKEHPGKKLLETHCYACHNPTIPENNGRIAPPMIAIKTRYLRNEMSKEDFMNQVVTFASNPTKDKAILFGAVRRFGVMPKQQFPEGVVEKIAEYIYDNKIEEPDWFQDHMKGNGFGGFSNNGNKISQNEAQNTVK